MTDWEAKTRRPAVVTWGIEWPDGTVAYRNRETGATSAATSIDVAVADCGVRPVSDLRVAWLDTGAGADIWQAQSLTEVDAAFLRGIAGTWQRDHTFFSPNVTVMHRAPAHARDGQEVEVT